MKKPRLHPRVTGDQPEACACAAVKSHHGKHFDRVCALKEASPCADGGRRYRCYVMQFDHGPSTGKLADISKMARGSYSWEALEAEIAKRDLVCGNCHAERTNRRRNPARKPTRRVVRRAA